MRTFRKTFAIVSAVAWISAAPTLADDALIAAAKKEGEVVWYTTQIVNQVVEPMKKAFEAKYGVKVSYLRGNGSETAIRVLNEIKAGKPVADVFDGPSTSAILQGERDDIVLKWVPDEAKSFPAGAVDPNSYWVATYMIVVAPAYNTDLIRPGTEPKNFEDLLDPKWKGKMAWSASNSSPSGTSFVGLMLDHYGEQKGMDYLRKLATQNIANLAVASRQVLDLTISGEYSIGLQISSHSILETRRQGAPVQWIPMSPAAVNSSNMSASMQAPHANAAKLLMEFLVSPEGQALYRDGGYIPANPKVKPLEPKLVADRNDYRGMSYTPELLAKKLPEWNRTFQNLFR